LERSISTVLTVSSTGLLKLSVDPQTLKLRSEGSAEIIYHVLFCYFSRCTGLIVQIEDSHLTRIQPHAGGDAVYWETTISSALEDYRALEGIMIAHSGRRGRAHAHAHHPHNTNAGVASSSCRGEKIVWRVEV
jgi:hypothetical protein